MGNLRHWLQLSMTEGIGPILSRRLIESAGSIEAACAANIKLLQTVEGIGGSKSGSIFESLKRSSDEVDAEIERAENAQVKIICPDDELYPILLKEIPDPPLVLYLRGDLQPRDLIAMAIVGSRRCS
jgi:DNA processing protein